MVSSRFVPFLVILLIAAGVPTLLHHSDQFDVDDCANSSALLSAFRGRVPLQDAVVFLKHPKEQMAEGMLAGGAIHYVVVRSPDPKTVYHWPEGRIVGEGRPDRRELAAVELEGGASLPIHRVHYDTDDSGGQTVRQVAYLLIYRSSPVSNPYRSQVLSAPLQLLTGRRPMWLFLVFGESGRRRAEEMQQAADDWLADAWKQYRLYCEVAPGASGAAG